MRNTVIRKIVGRDKIYYDRHRRLRKRIVVGGGTHRYSLPERKFTWGQVFIARRKAQELADFFAGKGEQM